MMSRMSRLAALAVAVLLATSGCGGDEPANPTDARGEPVEALPVPQVGPGGVTGMPGAPGPGQAGPAQEVPVPTPMYDGEGNLLPPIDPLTVDPHALPVDPATAPLAAEPPPARAEDAVEIVRQYYQAINERSFGVAHALWSGGGSASGQSPDQFARGFDNTVSTSMELMAPGQVGPAAGPDAIEVPVAIESTLRDGSVRRFVGVYTLRRDVPDGAREGQQAWRISAADIREVQP